MPPRHPHASAQPQQVRIIGGQWRRTRLPVPKAPGLRPTPDRVRETLFNWLGQDLHGWRVADAFAGAGALGLEAASRGAAHVLLAEQNPALVTHLRAQIERLHAGATVKVQRGDGIAALRAQPARSLDLALLDPPFDSDLFTPALAAAAQAVRAGGFIYLEAPRAWPPEALAAAGLRLHRHLHAGAVHAHLLQTACAPPPHEPACAQPAPPNPRQPLAWRP